MDLPTLVLDKVGRWSPDQDTSALAKLFQLLLAKKQHGMS